ncbi:serine/threonine-protein kinase [Lipingzhangella sp. LS1_29]|uniref:Serine/threonine-protein kinase n=1 Tax=Lipingzhangella rawalii TaxID=2055835 RepID=A0ABU2H9M8_9ACTN|nr:serine/threonine-protein kinase [Lipingzhangella rawalii]MDS1272024.1 serine/threonine-protein kinase [Lipingzhangella rawalii]
MPGTAGSTGGDEMPERIGQYRIRRRIGSGGMGVVYQAEDAQGQFVAVKVLRSEVAGDEVARARLAREVETMRRVHSRNVAEVLDADTNAHQPWVVTEYVPGMTLDDTVTDHGPLRGRALTRLVTGLARALDNIHQAGVIHRDLKPGNVIISNGEPIVIDFGIAHAVDSAKLTQTGTFVGTPSYLSPEVIEGTDLGPATDVHAWGATVAFAATGNPPYGAGAFEVIFYRILNGHIEVDGVPEELKPLVQRAVAREMSNRPSSAELVSATEQLNLDLPLEGADAAQVSGFTGTYTTQGPMTSAGLITAASGADHGRGATGRDDSHQQDSGPQEPAQADSAATMAAPAAAADQTMVSPATEGTDQTMVSPQAGGESGPADQTMAAPSVAGTDQTLVAGMEDPQTIADSRTSPASGSGGGTAEGPQTQFFNSTLRPDEFRDILTPVEERGRQAANPQDTAMFEPQQRDDSYYEPYYDPDFVAEEEADEPRRLPSLILIPLLLSLVGLSLMLPGIGLIVGLSTAVVLGAADMVRRQHARRLMERGPRNTDTMLIAMSLFPALLRRLGWVLVYGLLYLLIGAVVGLIVGLTPLAESTALYWGAYSVAIMILLTFVGPDGRGAREQANRWLTGIGIRNPYVYWGSIIACCLMALFFIGLGLDVAPDWRPIPFIS